MDHILAGFHLRPLTDSHLFIASSYGYLALMVVYASQLLLARTPVRLDEGPPSQLYFKYLPKGSTSQYSPLLR